MAVTLWRRPLREAWGPAKAGFLHDGVDGTPAGHA